MEIGALIKQKRIQKDMKLEELAKRVGVSAATVLGAGCRRFESCHPDMRKSLRNQGILRFSRLFLLRKRVYKVGVFGWF